MPEKKRTLYLIDGTALMYRAFFAFIRNPLVNSRGEDTSAPFGFCNTMLGLIREHRPDHLAVVFDTGKPTFRHELYEEYKATRQKMPGELVEQVPRVYEAVEALGLPHFEVEGFEADDVIGTLAVRAADQGFDVVMVTGDKDFAQLVTPRISMLVPMKNERLGPDEVAGQYGVPPERIVDLLGLMGDSSDNVPGLPRVGKKTALALIERFGTIDAVVDGWESIDKPSIRKSVHEHREQALLSRKLVTIRTDVPLDVKPDDLQFTGLATESALAFFRDMEFTSLIDMVKSDADIEPRADVTIVTAATLDDFFEELNGHEEFAIDLETTSLDPMRAEIVGISMAAGEKVWYLPIAHESGNNLDRDEVYPRLAPLLADAGRRRIGHNAKYDAIILKRSGLAPAPFAFDTMLAAYVLEPGIRGYALDKLSEEHLGKPMQSITELIGKGRNQKSFAEVDIESAAAYSGDDAGTTLKLKRLFAPRIDGESLGRILYDVEMPLMHVLMDMEMRGVRIDIPLLERMSSDLAADLGKLENDIYEAAETEFNINSPKQLAEILFDRLGLKLVRKTKTGRSTDMDVLTKLAHEHPLPALILDYRQLAKLKSTYVDALPTMVNERTGRIHTSFNQAVAATGRLSSSNPNLQNIPIRTEVGRRIRTAFIAPEGFVLLSADYSQIELRIMAHMSGDPVLTEAFRNGEDVHRKTASILFDVAPEKVTDDQRRQAKTINFGVMYGMGAYALSEQLGISRGEAAAFIDNYFATHTGVKDFIDTTTTEAREREYVTTLLGRKRYVRDIVSTNRNVAEFAKRMAINTPIQGSAADLIKVSMNELHKRLRDGGHNAHMTLQVHDELVLEVPGDTVDEVTALVKEVMEGAFSLDVPLVVDTGYGRQWLEAH